MRRGSLSDAIALAARAHAGQVDKAGAPYIGHPQRVTRSVAAAGGTRAAQIAAILHDVVEDSDVTLDALANAGFGPAVVSAVDALTRRTGESYADFVRRAGSHPISRLVKLADLADNLDSSRIAAPTPRDLERAQRYRDAWSALTGYAFPLGAPFPVGVSAEEDRTAEGSTRARGGEVEILNTHRGNERTVITARMCPDWSLEVAYQTLGDEVERETGDFDYEHYTTVSQIHVADVRRALLDDLHKATPSGGVLPLDSASVLDLLKALFGGRATPSSDFERWLRERGIPYHDFTY